MIIQTPKIHAIVSILNYMTVIKKAPAKKTSTTHIGAINVDIKIKADKEGGGYKQYGRDNSRKDRNQH